MSDMPSALPAHKRGGAGAAIGGALAGTAGALIRVTGKIFGGVRQKSGAAVADFRARPEHSRWRAYALGGYGLIVAATLLAQLYTQNPLGAYIRVQPVELPAMTQIFVRNDSRQPWNRVKLILNGIYAYDTAQVAPGQFLLLPVNKFALRDSAGKATYAPKNIAPKTLSLETDAQRYDTELRQ